MSCGRGGASAAGARGKYWMSVDPPYIIQIKFEQVATGMTWLLKMT